MCLGRPAQADDSIIRRQAMPREAVIHKVNPYELHGVLYYHLFLSYEGTPDNLRECRLAHDAIYPSPKDGDRVLVETILNMVTEIKRKND